MVRRATTVGALLGLTWGLSLRAWMAVLQVGSFGYLPDFTWWGTFGAVAAPALATGAVLGWAEGTRRTGGRPGWRWTAAAPLLMAAPVALTPGFVETLFDTGLGGGAIGVTLIGLTGGYSLSGRGPLPGRLAAGVLALGLTLATAGFTHFSAPDPITPAPVFGALLFTTLMGAFAAAASVPHRPVVTREAPTAAEPGAEWVAPATDRPAEGPGRSGRFSVGWWALALLAAAGTVHSVALALTDSGDWVAGHAGWAALSGVTLAVLVVPYRAGEAWAWWAVWAFVAAHAVVGLTRLDDPMIGYWYLGAAVLMTAAQALTRSDVRERAAAGTRHPVRVSPGRGSARARP